MDNDAAVVSADDESEASVNHRHLNNSNSSIVGTIEDVDYSSGDGNPAIHLMPDVTTAIRHQCERIIDDYYNNNQTEIVAGPHCQPTFDGWACWNATPAGSNAYSPCPFFITGFDPSRMAHKVCTEEGVWFKHPQSNLTWSNYTTCVDVEDLHMRQAIVNVYVTGYAISLIALVASLAILITFRQSLKCTRIYIHRNLFASFIINNAMWLLWYRTVVDHPEVTWDNGPACKILHVLLQYFLVSNYFWMFCEGLYLHTVLVVAFLAENSIMKWFHLIGWALPALFTIVYAAVRANIPTETHHCWMEETNSTWILSGPVCASMLANLIFLINIVRVLVTKLKAPASSCPVPTAPSASLPLNAATSDDDDDDDEEASTDGRNRRSQKKKKNHRSSGTGTGSNGNSNANTSQSGLRKAVRATLILLPLLGLHYLVMPFRPEAGAPGEIAYQVVSAVFTSFQGLCVAFLFCFCNGEVLQVLRKELVRYAASSGNKLAGLASTAGGISQGTGGRNTMDTTRCVHTTEL